MDDLSVKTYTIPIDTSIKYEENKSSNYEDLLKDSGQAPQFVSQASARPLETHLNQLFDPKITQWGGYTPPDGFYTQSDKLFGTSLTPSCTSERIELAKQRIAGKRKDLEKGSSNETISSVQKKAKTLESFLGTIEDMNRSLEHVRGAQAGFVKG